MKFVKDSNNSEIIVCDDVCLIRRQGKSTFTPNYPLNSRGYIISACWLDKNEHLIPSKRRIL